jgi:hypothetical protein
VTVGLPFLDCFLNENGTALAATGAPLPTCFGTWFWGCGYTPGRWEPSAVGKIDALPQELKILEPFKSRLNVFSGMKVHLDGRPSAPHQTGMAAIVTGTVPRPGERVSHPSLDNLVADTIGTRTRFRSLEVAATGAANHSLSRRSANAINPAEVSPLALYTRIFGPDFRDPNAADFVPDPRTMLRKSVLSAVTDERRALLGEVGSSARSRLEEYFTSVRELEQQLDLELQKPAALPACSVPQNRQEAELGTVIDSVTTNHRLFAQLIAHALACGQTRVANVVFCDSSSSLRRPGSSMTHHILTHEEGIDQNLGCQPQVAWFVERCMDGFRDMLSALDSVREADGTLLDRVLFFAASDTGYARIHSVENMPMMTAGLAGGRIRAGLHVQAKGDPGTRVGLTVQQAMGVPISSWGTDSMATSKTITEVLA